MRRYDPRVPCPLPPAAASARTKSSAGSAPAAWARSTARAIRGSDREVAIKLIPETFAADPSRVRRFEQEARAAGQLNHPNILAVYDVGIARRRAVHRLGAARGGIAP